MYRIKSRGIREIREPSVFQWMNFGRFFGGIFASSYGARKKSPYGPKENTKETSSGIELEKRKVTGV